VATNHGVDPIKVDQNKVELIRKAICTQAALSLEKSWALPAAAYTSEAFFEWEKENLFKTQWLSIVQVSQVPNMGDYINLELLGRTVKRNPWK
jgi:hypothetical protein